MQTQVGVAHDPEFQAGISTPALEPAACWNAALRFGFRFAFSYFVLYCFPFPVGALPYTQKLSEWYELGWHKVVPWVAQHWLHLAQPITIFSNGSGDTTYDYVKVLCFLVLAAVATIIGPYGTANAKTTRNSINGSGFTYASHWELLCSLTARTKSSLLSSLRYLTRVTLRLMATLLRWGSCGPLWGLQRPTPYLQAPWKCLAESHYSFRGW